MIQKTLTFAEEKIAQGQKVAWITVTKTHGSSPASVGQVMAVAADGQSAGTIGGGASEHHVAQQATEAMQAGEPVFFFAINHAEDGMVCGGGMEGVGTVLGESARLVIFGGGHVAQQLAPMAVQVGFPVCVVEDREALSTAFENVDFRILTPEAYGDQLPISSSDYVVICTRGHQSDDDALRYCLTQSPAYLGMIGSRRKVRTLMDRLAAEGVSADRLAQVYAPIGLAIATQKPAEIAVSILAEMLLVKNSGKPTHLRDAEKGQA